MLITTRHFLFPKAGNEYSECEDALSISDQNMRFCIADGASDSFDSRSWARTLARNWTLRRGRLNGVGSSFSEHQFCERVWLLAAQWNETWQRRDLPWHAEEKARRGAHAAFLGLLIRRFGCSLEWRALAVGDCCLVVVTEGGELISSFPLTSPDQFTNAPNLISTNVADSGDLSAHIQQATGVLSQGNMLLMMTDAMADWHLRTAVADSAKNRVFLDSVGQNDKRSLARLIEVERSNRLIRNDDIAIICICPVE